MTEMRFLETRNLKVVGVETTLSAGLKPVKAQRHINRVNA
jgi:hypothetical protein